MPFLFINCFDIHFFEHYLQISHTYDLNISY